MVPLTEFLHICKLITRFHYFVLPWLSCYHGSSQPILRAFSYVQSAEILRKPLQWYVAQCHKVNNSIPIHKTLGLSGEIGSRSPMLQAFTYSHIKVTGTKLALFFLAELSKRLC